MKDLLSELGLTGCTVFFMRNKAKKVVICHNILWSKYKGVIFSSLYQISTQLNLDVDFVQIAETENDRMGLASIDLRYHQYPYQLLFKGSYDDVSVIKLSLALLRATLFKKKYDAIVIPGYHRIEYWVLLLFAVIARVPCFVFCDSTANDRPSKTLKMLAKRVFFYFCHGFFCYGVRSKEYLMKHGVSADKIFHRVQTAALPLDYDAVQALAKRMAYLTSNPSERIFLYVGRLSVEKNLLMLLRAFSRVTKTDNHVFLDIVGSGPQQHEIAQYIADHELHGRVRLLGSKNSEDIVTHYQTAVALMLPSTSEPWGLVVNEALSYGCPVIVSQACGCVPELVIDHKTGFSFPSDDVDALAAHMMRVISADFDAVAIANNCFEMIVDYSPNRAAAQIIHGLNSIFREKN